MDSPVYSLPIRSNDLLCGSARRRLVSPRLALARCGHAPALQCQASTLTQTIAIVALFLVTCPQFTTHEAGSIFGKKTRSSRAHEWLAHLETEKPLQKHVCVRQFLLTILIETP